MKVRGELPLPDLLAASMSVSNERVKFIFLDCLWRSIWLIVTVLLVALVSMWLLGVITSTPIQGPDLDSAGPMMGLVLASELWSLYRSTIVVAASVTMLLAILCWLALEALFRGGWKGFWSYMGTGAARSTVLFFAGALLIMMLQQDRSADLILLLLLLMILTWFFVALVETLVRRDAVYLLATDLLSLTLVIGIFQMAEVLSAVILWGLAATVLVAASEGPAALAALLFSGFLLMLSAVVHSYLVSARFSAVDIMRRNIVDG